MSVLTPNGARSILLLGGGGGRDSWFQQCAGKAVCIFSFKIRYYWGRCPHRRMRQGGCSPPPQLLGNSVFWAAVGLFLGCSNGGRGVFFNFPEGG